MMATTCAVKFKTSVARAIWSEEMNSLSAENKYFFTENT